MRWQRSLSSRSGARGGTSCRPPSFYQAYAGFATSTGVLVFGRRSKRDGSNRKNVRRRALGSRRGYTGMAKGIANGLPLSLIVAKASVMVSPAAAVARAFGGNPVACAASLATIRLLENRYIRNANRRGQQLCEGLSTLAERFRAIREVRGLGLMIGVRISRDGIAPGLRDELIDVAFRRGAALAAVRPQHGSFCTPRPHNDAAGRNRSGDLSAAMKSPPDNRDC